MVDFLLAQQTPYTRSYLEDLAARFSIRYKATKSSYEWDYEQVEIGHYLILIKGRRQYDWSWFYVEVWEQHAYLLITLPKNYKGEDNGNVYTPIQYGKRERKSISTGLRA